MTIVESVSMNSLLDNAQNFNQALLAAMEAYTEQTCLQIRHGKRFRKITYQQFRTYTLRLVAYLHTQGIHHGERVVLIADNSLDWLVAYVATLLAGGVIVPLQASLHGNTLRFVLQDSGARLVILQKSKHITAVAAATAPDAVDRLFDLQTVIAIGKSADLPSGFVPMSTLLSGTYRLSDEAEKEIYEHAAALESHTLASIFYVPSGTGKPKGAIFEQSQLLARMRSLAQVFPFDQHDLVFTWKTWGEAHSLAPTLYCFLMGIPVIAQAEGSETLLESLQQTSPTVLFATPHSLELFYQSCLIWLEQQPESNQKVFQWALSKGREYWAAGEEASASLTQVYRRADLTFFSQLRGQMGGRLRYLYSTGASLPTQLTAFYEAIGIPVLNLYSLAETGGFPAASRPDAIRLGSAGVVTPGFEIRITDAGEILVRAETMMRGYWRRSQETKRAVDAQGWLGSGDQGYLDEDGFLFITGRQEHLIVLSVGRKITPAPVEEALLASPFVAEVAVFGDNQPYLAALIRPDMGAINAHLRLDKPISNVAHPQVTRLLDDVVTQVNTLLDQWERVQAYKLLDPEEVAAGILSENGRHALADRFAADIASMYPTTHTLQLEEVSQVQVDPERLRALLEKESILDAWMEDAGIEFLFDLARNKRIDVPSMIHICDIAATIAQIESEEKPLSTAFIVGDPVRIGHVLPESQMQLLYHDHIRRMRNTLVNLAQLVDGMVLGYVLDRYGYVRGIHKINVTISESSSMLLGPQFRHHAAISARCDALVFFVPYGGRQVRVFANGDLVGRYANGDWYPDNIAQLDTTVASLAQTRSYDHALLRRILRVAFQMSEDNQGAIFMLGDADLILQQSDAAETSGFATILSANIADMSDSELINFAKQDGATVIDKNGRFRGCMVLLRPDAQTRADIGPGKGARHSSAAKTSREADCLAVTVSQDGPITVYDGGKRVLSV